MKYTSGKYCSNCFYPLPYKAKFCAHCGQKLSDTRISMGSLLKKLWNSTFHLEGKYIRGSWQLFIPGFVTQEYFKGKIQRYPHPLRFFAITAFFFLLLLNLSQTGQDTSAPVTGADGGTNLNIKDSAQNIDFKLQLGEQLFDYGKKQMILYDVRKKYLALPDSMQSPRALQALDSAVARTQVDWGLTLPGLSAANVSDSMGIDTINLSVLVRTTKVALIDIFRYTPTEICEKYGYTHWLDKLTLRQGIKTLRNPESLLHTFLGSLTWTLLAQTAVMAGVLYLLYYRKRRFYVEHFVLLLHHETAAMLALTGVLLLGLLIPLAKAIGSLLVIVWSLGAFWVAMRRVYGGSAGMTTLKWLLFTVLYLLFFIVLFLAGLILVTLVY